MAKKSTYQESGVLAALGRLQTIEQDIAERLTRVEENLHLLRSDLMGNGQPGRLRRIEIDLDSLRSELQRQRGVIAGVSMVISSAIAILAQFFSH